MKECLQINVQKLSAKEKRTKDMNRQATREKTPMANNREKMFNLIRNFKNNTGRSCFAYHIDKGLQHLGVQCYNPNLKLLENQTKPPKRDPSVYEFITKFLPLLGTLPPGEWAQLASRKDQMEVFWRLERLRTQLGPIKSIDF